jgi:arylsulfatase A-like enzyme
MHIAGQPAPSWVEGDVLPQSDDDARTRDQDATVTEWDSALFGVDVHVRSVLTKEYLYTEYGRGTMHDGSEGELYDLRDDPLQRVNLFEDPSRASARIALHERLRAHEDRPGERAEPGVLLAPV